jgi:hypothetical protein
VAKVRGKIGPANGISKFYVDKLALFAGASFIFVIVLILPIAEI